MATKTGKILCCCGTYNVAGGADNELLVGEIYCMLESGRGQDGAAKQGVTNVKCQCVCTSTCTVHLRVHVCVVCACTWECELLAMVPGKVSLNNRKTQRSGPYKYLPCAHSYHRA